MIKQSQVVGEEILSKKESHSIASFNILRKKIYLNIWILNNTEAYCIHLKKKIYSVFLN